MHSRVQQPCKFIGTKESVYLRKELNSHRIGLVKQHGCRFIVLEHQYICHDVMCILSISSLMVNPDEPPNPLSLSKASNLTLSSPLCSLIHFTASTPSLSIFDISNLFMFTRFVELKSNLMPRF